MKPAHQIQPLGVLRPENKHAYHELLVTLKGNDGTSWSTAFELDTTPFSPRRMLILELPSKVEKESGKMVQLSDTHSEFIVQLRGPASPATIRDLSATPIESWMVTLFTRFAEAKAAIGILVTGGRVSVALHEGE